MTGTWSGTKRLNCTQSNPFIYLTLVPGSGSGHYYYPRRARQLFCTDLGSEKTLMNWLYLAMFQWCVYHIVLLLTISWSLSWSQCGELFSCECTVFMQRTTSLFSMAGVTNRVWMWSCIVYKVVGIYGDFKIVHLVSPSHAHAPSRNSCMKCSTVHSFFFFFLKFIYL